MATLSNVNITITATDQTAGGVNSALGNVSRLGSGFSSVGSIAAGVFGGVLGANVFSRVVSGIGGVVSGAMGLNSRMQESSLVASAMVKSIAATEPEANRAFGGASKAAEAFARTMREIRERESDGLADYAAKIDDIKARIQDAQQDAKNAVSERIAKEKQQLQDLESQYAATYKRINENIIDENRNFEERMYDMANSKQDKLDNLAEQRADKEEDIAGKIADLNEDLLDAQTQAEEDAILAKIALRQQELTEFIAKNDAEKAKVIERADHEIAFATQTHNIKIQRLQQELTEEQAEYKKRRGRIEEDAKADIERAKKTSDEKVANLQQQLKKEEENHKRFLRDIQQAYADAATKMDSAGSSGGGGTVKRLQFDFEFNKNLKGMDDSQINEFLDGIQQKYVEIGVKSPFNIGDMQEFGKTMIRYTDGSVDNMETLLNIGQMLATLDPMQGLHGAALGLNELLSGGNARALASRFELPPNIFEGLDKAASNPTELYALMEERLAGVGLTMEVVEARTKALSGASDNVSETFAILAATLAKPFYDMLTNSLIGVNKFLAEHYTQIKGVADQVAGFMAGGGQQFIDFFIFLGEQIGLFWAEHGVKIIQWFTDIWNGIQINVIPALELLKTIWTTVQKAIEEVILPSMQRIFDRIAILWQKIAPEVKATLEFLKQWWDEHSNQIMGIIKIAWAIIEFVIMRAIEGVALVIRVILAAIRGDWEGAWKAIKDYVSGMWDAIKNLAKGLWDGIGTYFKDGINSIIDKVNGFINSINRLGEKKIKVGDVEIGGFSIPNIPRLAMGGIVTSPTIAMIGEAGPEAVIPLSGKQRGMGAGGGVNVYVTGNEIMDDQTARRLADMIGIQVADSLRLQGNYL
jgi:hypothetical protein